MSDRIASSDAPSRLEEYLWGRRLLRPATNGSAGFVGSFDAFDHLVKGDREADSPEGERDGHRQDAQHDRQLVCHEQRCASGPVEHRMYQSAQSGLYISLVALFPRYVRH